MVSFPRRFGFTMRSPRLSVLVALLVYCIGVKVLSHHAATMSSLRWFPWNFSPLYALGLFGAAMYRPKFWAYAAVPVAFCLGDVLIAATSSLHDGFRLLPTLLNYTAILGFVLCGALIRGRTTWPRVLTASTASGALFYVLTNFGAWWYDPSMPTPVGYTRDLAGLIQCYAMGIPFAYSQFASLFLFTALFFSPQGLAVLTREGTAEPTSDESISVASRMPSTATVPVPVRKHA